MNRTQWFALVVAVALVGCSKNSSTAGDPIAGNGSPASSLAPLTKLKVEDVKLGTGPGAVKGDSLTMTYTGKLADGTVFDTNDKPGGKPFTFSLGFGAVIKGWDQGLLGMKKGGQRKLSIPAALAYGDKAMGGGKIPANSDLYFDVKLVDILREEDRTTIQIKDIKLGSGPGIKIGQTAVINYTGTLSDGSPIDAQSDPKKPFSFKVGANPLEVIQGIDNGIVGMKKGGERMIQIPPGFGPQNPSIPPNSVTKYDVILRDIKH